MFLRLTCPHVPACVGYDPHRREDVHVVDGGRRGLGHVQDDENQEDRVGEGGVDAPVQGDAPLLHEPGNVAGARGTRQGRRGETVCVRLDGEKERQVG